ncbi:MAG: glycogen/starch synthase [Candidatus Electrothrix aestuarii]|uniref:starch synthase n=1 Tax=Candidatus Electrothrix aestuarii TaxID=3062594 RepID=A0AAU8LZS3_9BACT|nr:glycogen/starch synthase [Candidatus Electrothrix aestuarii]
MENINKILMVTREYDGVAGAGGVKDVCRQLSEALVHHAGCDVRVVLPCYGFIDPPALGFERMQVPCREDSVKMTTVFDVDMNYPDKERRESVSLWMKKEQGVVLYLLDSLRFAEKQAVYTYTSVEEEEKSWQKAGTGHFDFFAMNVLLQKAALDLMILLDLRPDIIHCHDGHAAILPAMLWEHSGYRHFFCQTGTVVTVHNAGLGYHQDVDDLEFAKAITGLPGSVIRSGLFNDAFNPFVAAAGYAQVNTVSENYARELQETDEDSRTGWLGHKLLKKGVDLVGITNGVNPEDFNPTQGTQKGLAGDFNPETGELDGKRSCKEEILRACRENGEWTTVKQYGSLGERLDSPLFTFIGRLTAQKGVDILLQAVSLLITTDFQLLVLGSGDRVVEQKLQDLAEDDTFRGQICFLKGYDPDLALKIYAAGDFFLIPSLYEPCGLTDYIAQLYGNLPIVHQVGGLVKVLDGETGFAYQGHTPEALAETMRKTLGIYQDAPDQLAEMRRAAVENIRRHHSWQHVMEDYLSLYQKAL